MILPNEVEQMRCNYYSKSYRPSGKVAIRHQVSGVFGVHIHPHKKCPTTRGVHIHRPKKHRNHNCEVCSLLPSDHSIVLLQGLLLGCSLGLAIGLEVRVWGGRMQVCMNCLGWMDGMVSYLTFKQQSLHRVLKCLQTCSMFFYFLHHLPSIPIIHFHIAAEVTQKVSLDFAVFHGQKIGKCQQDTCGAL